jgi:hypothetical protein
MLTIALRQRDRREAVGQLIRLIVAAPGSISGSYPEGNTGRATVGLTEAMPVPEDLAVVLNADVPIRRRRSSAQSVSDRPKRR